MQNTHYSPRVNSKNFKKAVENFKNCNFQEFDYWHHSREKTLQEAWFKVFTDEYNQDWCIYLKDPKKDLWYLSVDDVDVCRVDAHYPNIIYNFIEERAEQERKNEAYCRDIEETENWLYKTAHW